MYKKSAAERLLVRSEAETLYLLSLAQWRMRISYRLVRSI